MRAYKLVARVWLHTGFSVVTRESVIPHAEAAARSRSIHVYIPVYVFNIFTYIYIHTTYAHRYANYRTCAYTCIDISRFMSKFICSVNSKLQHGHIKLKPRIMAVTCNCVPLTFQVEMTMMRLGALGE